jgi:aminopeptidase-like protein
MNRTDDSAGQALLSFAAELYPICRSITGRGVRQTLQLIGQRIPLKVHEVPSGSRVYDWDVPLEWNINDAYVMNTHGERVVDFRAHNLHLVSYSEPVRTKMPLAELRRHLHVHAANPDWIPYRTSYYKRSWGFCLRRRDLDSLPDGDYEVSVDSTLSKGSLTYGEFTLPGRSRDEFLLFTHICHPSLANDNAAGMAIATELAAWLASAPRRYTYRVVFAPGTIGSLCWLKRNERRLGRVRHGLVLGLLGDPAPLTYKQSRRGDAEIDEIAAYALRQLDPLGRVIPFEPYGYDERQLCSPGFNLPVGRLTRSVNDGYPQYHSSADNLDLLLPENLARSLDACKTIVEVAEGNDRYVNLLPKGEPRLGKRGLYGAVGGQSPAARERAMLWVLNQSDGTRSLLDIANRSELDFPVVHRTAAELEHAGLLRAAKPAPSSAKSSGVRPRAKPSASRSKSKRTQKRRPR